MAHIGEYHVDTSQPHNVQVAVEGGQVHQKSTDGVVGPRREATSGRCASTLVLDVRARDRAESDTNAE
jgi:hypothetical protein